MPDPSRTGPDVIVVGSGFGGAMAAHALIERGARVLMLERGDWVERGEPSWHPTRGFFQHSRHYVRADGTCSCVGGASVFYGAASLRLRERDFESDPAITAGSGAEWPFGYEALEPHYTHAEHLLGVAGEAGRDPTEPPRSGEYPAEPAPLAPISRRIAEAAEAMGLTPFRLPLALNRVGGDREECRACITCDGYACRIGAKNDVASVMIPALLATGRLELRTGARVTRLVERGGRIAEVRGFDGSGAAFRHEAPTVVVAAGALSTPQLLLASGLERVHGPAHVVGRYLMRHCNAFVYGWFPGRPNDRDIHHKQLGINDFYFGDPSGGAPEGKLGNIQQVMHPQLGGVFGIVPGAVSALGALGPRIEGRVLGWAMAGARHVTGLQVIAEDQPRRSNRVTIDAGSPDRFGLAPLRISHAHTERDEAARAVLVRKARAILREAGAFRLMYPHRVNTFSHAVGTVRTGRDPATSALEESCRFRGIDNLYVTDGSFMPTSGGVNPSLTIAANALRVGQHIAERG